MTQSTMHAAAIDKYGAPVTPHTLPVPRIEPDEVLIRVQSAGVGVWDPWVRDGKAAEFFERPPRFPYVLGTDGAGTIEDVGEQVRGLKKGDRVYAMEFANPKGGFYAEFAAVKAEHAAPIPGKLTVQQAGALPVDAMTALIGLDDTLHLKSGEMVLIFGASGGIGHLAVQLAKRMGARVFAVASGGDGMDLAKRLGADAVVEGHNDDVLASARRFAPNGIHAALLTAGGKAAEKALESLRDGGRVAYPHHDGMPTPEAMAKLNRLIEQAPFEVHVDRTFTLDEAAEALPVEEHHVGKIALIPRS